MFCSHWYISRRSQALAWGSGTVFALIIRRSQLLHSAFLSYLCATIFPFPRYQLPVLPITHLVAIKLDRLFRNAIDALNMTKEWDDKNITLHLVDFGG